MDSSINFHNEDVDFELKKSASIISALRETIENHDCEVGNINYIFCSDEYLLDLNKKYLEHDYYTDILSFQMEDNPVSGDIFISIERVKDNSKHLNEEFEVEIKRVIAHGVLHFLGYKDATDEEKKTMRKRENEVIALINKAE